jgi:hypothetical protein
MPLPDKASYVFKEYDLCQIGYEYNVLYRYDGEYKQKNGHEDCETNKKTTK